MDFYKTLRHPEMATPKYTGFEWPRKVFADGKPRRPWDLITVEDSEEILHVYQKLYVELFNKIDNDGFMKGKIMSKYDDKLSILPENYCQRFEQLDSLLQDYGKGVNWKTPFNNPLGAPVAAIKTSVTESSAVPGLLVMVYLAEDEKYYRAEITEIVDHEWRMACLYDRGVSVIANVEQLYYLPHRFDVSTTPVFVFPVKTYATPSRIIGLGACGNRLIMNSLKRTDGSIDEVETIVEQCCANQLSLNRSVSFYAISLGSGTESHMFQEAPWDRHQDKFWGFIDYPFESMKEELEKFVEENNSDQGVRQQIQDFLRKLRDNAA